MNLKKKVNMLFDSNLNNWIEENPEVRKSLGMIAAFEYMQRLERIAFLHEEGCEVYHKMVKMLHDAVRISFHFALKNDDAITLTIRTFNKGEKLASCVCNIVFIISSGRGVAFF